MRCPSALALITKAHQSGDINRYLTPQHLRSANFRALEDKDARWLVKLLIQNRFSSAGIYFLVPRRASRDNIINKKLIPVSDAKELARKAVRMHAYVCKVREALAAAPDEAHADLQKVKAAIKKGKYNDVKDSELDAEIHDLVFGDEDLEEAEDEGEEGEKEGEDEGGSSYEEEDVDMGTSRHPGTKRRHGEVSSSESEEEGTLIRGRKRGKALGDEMSQTFSQVSPPNMSLLLTLKAGHSNTESTCTCHTQLAMESRDPCRSPPRECGARLRGRCGCGHSSDLIRHPIKHKRNSLKNR